MPVTEFILTQIATKTFGYLIEASKDSVNKTLFGDPKEKAFERALEKAVRQLEAEYPEWVDSLFDESFFVHEGAPVLAQFLLRDGNPDASEMAKL
jgi:hypothetical protein